MKIAIYLDKGIRSQHSQINSRLTETSILSLVI